MVDLLLSFLRDQSWGFAGAVVAVVAFVFTVWSVMRKTKAVAYRVFQRQLVSLQHDDFGGRVQLLLDGQPTQRLWAIWVDITNTGAAAIAPDDFYRPIQLKVGPPGAKIIECTVTSTTPKQLEISVLRGPTPDAVAIEPTLLNPGDSFSVMLFASDTDGDVSVDYRVAGLSRMTPINVRSSMRRRESAKELYLTFMAITLGEMMMAIYLNATLRGDGPVSSFFGAFWLMVVTALTAAAVILVRRRVLKLR